MSDLCKSVATYGDVEIEVFGPDGDKWAAVNCIALALGYKHPRYLRTLVSQMAKNGELSEGGHFKWLPLPTRGGTQESLVLSHRGVIRVCMRSDAPNAIPFRDWAETVLFHVMVKGYYIRPDVQPQITAEMLTPILQPILAQVTAAMTDMLKAVCDTQGRIASVESRLSQVALMPANRDITTWLTPTQRLKELGFRKQFPKTFNSGAHFDHWFAEQHKTEFGHYPETRCRRFLAKRPEYVVEPCPEVDDLLRRSFKRYLKNEWPREQRELQLGYRSGLKVKYLAHSQEVQAVITKTCLNRTVIGPRKKEVN